jgi:hypothetical protein
MSSTPLPPSHSTPPDGAPSATVDCPSCHTAASGKFCSNCGATLAAANCAACGAPLTAGGKFCHRCGTPAGADRPTEQRGFAGALPWAIAGIALLAMIALIAGQRFAHGPDAAPQTVAQSGTDPNAAPFASGTPAGQPPDLSNMTQGEAAIRLYDRVMGAHERGQTDTVQMFAPMAMAAYQMLGNLDLDQRYDLGRISAVVGQEPLARAEADSILALHPNHLLGLILAGNAAHLRKDTAAERSYHDKLVAAAKAERAKQLPEYVTHENDITVALDSKRP